MKIFDRLFTNRRNTFMFWTVVYTVVFIIFTIHFQDAFLAGIHICGFLLMHYLLVSIMRLP